MINAKTAREGSDKRRNDIIALHTDWFLKRAEIAITSAMDHGREWAAFDADDLIVGAWEKGKEELIKLGYEVKDDVGHIRVTW